MKTLSEQHVLDKLGISDFRHMTKDKAITMVSLLDKMDPEVAKIAMAQFPDFANTMKDMFAQYKLMIDGSLASNNESVNSYYKTCDDINTSCQKLLERDNRSSIEKQYIIDCMIKVANMKDRKDTENKAYNIALTACVSVTIGIALTALNVALGGKASVNPFELMKG